MTKSTYTPDLAPIPAHKDNKLPVSELFYSIQGEGRFAGTPALFIRFKYCNLGCIWCDTRFTWDTRKIEDGELFSLHELTNRAAQLVDKALRKVCHVVLTGGEPMLHQQELPALIHALRTAGFGFVEIETNGMFAPTAAMAAAIDWWNCSPKLTNNGLTVEENRIPEVIQSIAATSRADFKFVVENSGDIAELERDYLPLLPRDRIILMPEGVTRERQLALTPWLLQECTDRGYRFSPRLHILAFGNERGK